MNIWLNVFTAFFVFCLQCMLVGKTPGELHPSTVDAHAKSKMVRIVGFRPLLTKPTTFENFSQWLMQMTQMRNLKGNFRGPGQTRKPTEPKAFISLSHAQTSAALRHTADRPRFLIPLRRAVILTAGRACANGYLVKVQMDTW